MSSVENYSKKMKRLSLLKFYVFFLRRGFFWDANLTNLLSKK